jgi:Putative zinc-finger
MDHQDAARLLSVEKYLLNELPPDLRDEFEEHLFDCQECAADLRATAAFLDAAKLELKAMPLAVATPEKFAPRAAKKSRLSFLWAPAFVLPALAACLLVIAYQNVVVYPRFAGEVAQLKTPEVLQTLSLAGGNSRGGDVPSSTVRGTQPLLLSLDIPTQDRFPNYTCLLYSPSGKLAWSIEVSAQQAKDTIAIRIPAVNGEEGSYTLLVRGNPGPGSGTSVDLARYHFTVNLQN